MPATIEATDLDALIEDLDTRITETDLAEGGGDSSGCSGVCTIVVCTVIVC